MATTTPRLGLPRPEDSDNVSLANEQALIDAIDANAASRSDLDNINPTTIGAETPAGAQAKVNTHASRTDNPHGVTVTQIGAAPASHTHSADNVTSGTFVVARIPNLPADMITSGTLADARIPSMNASKITAGSFHADRIPSLPASKITSGTLGVDRIPNISAAKITSGTLPVSRGGTGGTSKSSARSGIGIFVQSGTPSGLATNDLWAW